MLIPSQGYILFTGNSPAALACPPFSRSFELNISLLLSLTFGIVISKYCKGLDGLFQGGTARGTRVAYNRVLYHQF